MSLIVGLILVAVPFIFGTLRLISTGTDARYLAVAAASTVAAFAVFAARSRTAAPTASTTTVAFLAATTAAAAAGFALGAMSVGAVLFVAAGFAVCSTAGLWLARRR